MIADLINVSRPLEKMNQVGLAELILTRGWYICWERRKFVHGESIQHPARSAISIATLAKNYHRSMQKIVRQRGVEEAAGREATNQCRWKLQSEESSGGASVVIRDSNGSFIAGSYACFEHIIDAPAAEAMALKEGLRLAQQIGCNSFILQSDCSEVVETIRVGWSAAASAPMYDDCFLLWQNFYAISIERCDREANMVAFKLARVAFSLKESCIWVDEPLILLIKL